MDESSGGQEVGDSTDANDKDLPGVIDIAPGGDVILEVIFNTSKETLKAARLVAARSRKTQINPSSWKTQVIVRYRVESSALKKHSKYFNNLLSDSRFQEAKTVAAALKSLSLRNIQPQEADIKDLPMIEIVDDDVATRLPG
jgi:hypothetical protein